MSDYIIRSHNNVFGHKKKACYAGEFNVGYEGKDLFIYIYLQDVMLIKLLCYKNPWQIAVSILGHPEPKQIVNEINGLKSRGLIEGRDFTITEKGVYERVKYSLPEETIDE